VSLASAGVLPRNRLSRFTVVGDTADPESEEVLLELQPNPLLIHNGGAVHFGPDGKLYLAVGDHVRLPESQMLDSALGKLLRLVRCDPRVAQLGPVRAAEVLDRDRLADVQHGVPPGDRDVVDLDLVRRVASDRHGAQLGQDVDRRDRVLAEHEQAIAPPGWRHRLKRTRDPVGSPHETNVTRPARDAPLLPEVVGFSHAQL
jgi:hypothetical protein